MSGAPSAHAWRKQLEGSACAVTGGAGFIGRHLVQRLLQSGTRRVVVLDRAPRLARLRTLAGAERLDACELDLGATAERADLAALESTLRGCDYVFHLAAEKHHAASATPERALQVNVLGTERVLRAATRCGVRKLVFSSSLLAHGGRDGVLREDDVAAPDTVYGLSKLAGEHLLRSYAREHGLRSTSLRLFFIYGPHQDHGRSTPSLIVHTFERILRGEPPLLRGDGQQALDYLYIDDALDALLCALQPSADGELFNIGSGDARSVEQLVRTMLALADSNLPIERSAGDGTHDTRRIADITRARERLGWSPAITLEEGLRRTLAWLRARTDS